MPDNRTLLDTSAWFELLLGTKRGKKIEELTEQKTLCASTIAVAEICSAALRQGLDEDAIFRDIMERAILLKVDAQIAIHGARLFHVARKKHPKISLADTITYMSADELGATFITCDNDFAGMKNVIVVR